MSDSPQVPRPGTISWRDLTVADAASVRDFYQAVVGWTHRPEPMGDYEDYCMIAPATGEVVAGVCHARGTNANVPPQWLMYINVEDVDASAQKACELGGAVLDGPRMMGAGRFAVIRDPAGAVCALYARAKS
jgi:predicted enzyme related to lactoylglutathione lyase